MIEPELTYADYVRNVARDRDRQRCAEAHIGTNAHERARLGTNPEYAAELDGWQEELRAVQARLDRWQGEIDIAHHDLREREINTREHLASALMALAAWSPLPTTTIGDLARAAALEAVADA